MTSKPTFGVAIFPQYPPAEFTRACALVEELGFEHLWIPDERFFRDLGVEMAVAASVTKRITIGSAVTDPYIRHPALTASLMASLDELSGGRIVCGIGAGISGFKAMGVKQEKPQLAIREAITLMRSLWRGEHLTFEGKTTRFINSRLDYTPVRPEIPIWVAGRGPAVLPLAGEVADGAMVGALASEPGLLYARTRVDAGVEKAGRKDGGPKRALWLHTAVAQDGESARDAVRPIVVGVLVSSKDSLAEIGVPLPEELMRSLEGVTYGMNEPSMQRVAATLKDDVLQHFSVAGDPSEVRARMDSLAALGVDHVAIVPWLAKGQDIETFVRDLARAVR
jgi:5,10-methylenetetrahydromethanopterin reductase